MSDILKVIVGVIAALVVVGAVVTIISTSRPGEDAAVAPDTETKQVASSPEPKPKQPEPEAEPPVLEPKFDVVRIDPDGNAVVAGRASPGAVIEVLLDGQVVATATADRVGQFVSLFSVQASDGPHRLDLRAATADAEETQVATADVEETQIADADAEDTQAVDESEPAEESGSVVILPGEEEGSTPAIVQSEPEGLALLQPASPPQSSSESVKVVVLDRISYDDGGDVDLQGRAVPGQVIRVYADSELTAEIPVTHTGEWRARLDAETGRRANLLRLDEIDSNGKVVSRVETELTYGVDHQTEETGWRTIQISKGDYLWHIAERFYGKGVRYSVIFLANTNLIRDPDLIYPGQVFTVPESVEQ